MVDARDKFYGSGDTIVYPVRNGVIVVMREAVIERIVCSCGSQSSLVARACPGNKIRKIIVRRGGKLLTLTSFKNIVKVEK